MPCFGRGFLPGPHHQPRSHAQTGVPASPARPARWALFPALTLALAGPAGAQQLTNAGQTLYVGPGATLYVGGDLLNAAGSTLTNAGTLRVTGTTTTNAAMSSAGGTLVLAGSRRGCRRGGRFGCVGAGWGGRPGAPLPAPTVPLTRRTALPRPRCRPAAGAFGWR